MMIAKPLILALIASLTAVNAQVSVLQQARPLGIESGRIGVSSPRRDSANSAIGTKSLKSFSIGRDSIETAPRSGFPKAAKVGLVVVGVVILGYLIYGYLYGLEASRT